MEIPSARHCPEAYVPAARGAAAARWPGADRAEVIERARRARIAEGGLPVDADTLDRVADAVMDPDYRLPGLFHTPEECDDEVPEHVVAAVRHYLAARPDVGGDLRLGWRNGRRVVFAGIAGDLAPHERDLTDLAGDRVVVERAARSAAELDAVHDRISRDAELMEGGGDWVVLEFGRGYGVVEIDVVGGAGEPSARAFFAERYGPLVRVAWLGPTWDREVPHPFGSFSCAGRRLVVFFGIGHNGERFGSAAVAEEHPDRVVVALTRFEPVGPHTLVGGFTPKHVEVELAEPLAGRRVVDASTGEGRPSAARLRR